MTGPGQAMTEQELKLIERQWREIGQQRERMTYLKEGSGNLGLALLVPASVFTSECLSSTAGLPHPVLFLALYITAIFLIVTHWVHAVRQAAIEIWVLNEYVLISPQKATAMIDVLPNWFGEKW